MFQPKPEWLKVKIEDNEEKRRLEALLKTLSINTVCEEASCPNIMECFCRKTATFMILGKICTRNCTFCNVNKGSTLLPDPEEPANIAKAVSELKLKHAVITSVTRDDLPDGGAAHFAAVIEAIREIGKGITIEVLIPDFGGNVQSLRVVTEECPEILSHNVETVPRLYSEVRQMAEYSRSLELLQRVKLLKPEILTKSGIMLGLGEKENEVLGVMQDLLMAGCRLLTIGQYLAPSKLHHPVVEYVHPDTFENYRQKGLEMGFKHVFSAPFVRSSYMSEKILKEVLQQA